MKSKRFLWMLGAMLTPCITLTLSSCTDKDDNPATPEKNYSVITLDDTVPTDDQMGVRVTADVPTAVLSTFEAGSTGAAFVSRLPQTTGVIDSQTKMVLIKGSDFGPEGSMDAERMKPVTQLYLHGGYIALERPTYTQVTYFLARMLQAVVYIKSEETETLFDVTPEAAARSAEQSPAVVRLQSRMENMKRMAQTRAGADYYSDHPDEVMYEMVILKGDHEYFMQEPFEEETVAYVHHGDSEGNVTEPEAVVSTTKRTAAISGQMADAAAQWLNDTEAERTAAARRAPTRASGSSAINELMDASETFTYSGAICYTHPSKRSVRYENRVLMKVSSWGIHNMESNKDYYYLKQNVTLRMGEIDGNKIYHSSNRSDEWFYAEDGYKYWFGAFLSQYDTSMELTGDGSITLEASAPNTDNNSASKSITTGTSHSTSQTNGISCGLNAGMATSGPSGGFSLGYSHTWGTTDGTSFSVGTSQTNKELAVKKNTTGAKASWTYTGTLPKIYWEKRIPYHEIPADILVNDCDVAEEICWSVDNPSGQYTVNISSTPQTAALWKKDDTGNSYYIYDSNGAATYTHQLLEPNRAMQTWRMYVTIDNWEFLPDASATDKLESEIANHFPDIYASEISIADKTATSLNSITHVVNSSKQILKNDYDILQGFAKSLGIKQYTINWRCDDTNITTREGFTVNAAHDYEKEHTPEATDGTQNNQDEGYKYLLDGNKDTKWCTSTRKDGVYFVEFKYPQAVTPKGYYLTTANDNSSYPDRKPKNWKLMAKSSEKGSWSVIAEVKDDKKLPDGNGTTVEYDFTNWWDRAHLYSYQYFRFEVSETWGDASPFLTDDMVQLADLVLKFDK